MFVAFVANPRPKRERARDRRWVRSRVGKSLRRAFADTPHHVRKDLKVRGGLDRHTFDYGVENAKLRQLVQTLALEGQDRPHLKTEVDALAWAIDDVRATTPIPIVVVTIGSGSLFETAKRIYEGLNAQIVTEPEIEDWAAAAPGQLSQQR